jgi:tripartite ATP-independent transporter DctM subunit
MNSGLLLIIGLLVFSVMGLPIYMALGIATLGVMVLDGSNLIVLPQKFFTGLDSSALLAIPFFMLAGNLMSGSINKKLIAFANALFGWVRGSLAVITVVASGIFAAISGSGVATVSAIGGTTIPAMKKEGYSGAFAAALASMASILGPIIPPSLFLIVYGSATESSISQLFMAAVVPGVGLMLLLVLYALLYAKKRNFPAQPKSSAKEIGKVTMDSFWALLMPVIILGGIFLGIFTPTEAAAVSAFYALIIGLFIYKDLKLKNLIGYFAEAAVTTATIMMLLGFSKASSWVIIRSRLPQEILVSFMGLTQNPVIILLLINVLLLIVGMLMEGNAAIIMLTPLLMPLLNSYHISTVHFGVVMALNLCIGLVTPPVGACILLGNTIAKEKLEYTLKAAIPMILVSLVWLMIVTYVPSLTLFLPGISK